MSDTIRGVSGTSAVSAITAAAKKKDENTQDIFAKMVSNLQQGAPATGYGDENGTTMPDGTKITIMRQTMSDGSVLITVRAGEKIVSQTRTHPVQKEEKPQILKTSLDTNDPAQHDRSITSIVSDGSGVSETLAERFNNTSASITVGGSFDSEG